MTQISTINTLFYSYPEKFHTETSVFAQNGANDYYLAHTLHSLSK